MCLLFLGDAHVLLLLLSPMSLLGGQRPWRCPLSTSHSVVSFFARPSPAQPTALIPLNCPAGLLFSSSPTLPGATQRFGLPSPKMRGSLAIAPLTIHPCSPAQ